MPVSDFTFKEASMLMRTSLLTLILLCFSPMICTQSSLDWIPDLNFSDVAYSGCDFPVYTQENITFANKYEPYILRKSILHWSAFVNWKKDELLKNYGQRTVRFGSESSIVHSGGVAENQTTLADMIHSMSTSDSLSTQGTSFIFDTTILRVIPELNQDFDVPKVFRSWDNPENETKALVWHMLSLGPSKSGLSFDNHGQTWLAVVHGIKQWFIYPPGFDPPVSIDAEYNPMKPVRYWVENILPRLRNYPKPHLLSILRNFQSNKSDALTRKNLTASAAGYRPLECRQYPGDLLYLPPRWAHLTVNIGETIAIGGQEALQDDIRHNTAVEVLKNSPGNYDAWKDLGLAQYNMAFGKHQNLRRLAGLQEPGVIYVSGVTELDKLQNATQDSFLVLYHDGTNLTSSNSENQFQKLHVVWSHLAEELQDVLNVVVCDIQGTYTIERAFDYLLELDRKDVEIDRRTIRWTEQTEKQTMYMVDPEHLFLTLPMAKLHRGSCVGCYNIFSLFDSDLVSPGRVSTPTATGISTEGEAKTPVFLPDTSGLVFEGNIGDIAGVAQLVHHEMNISNLAPGSISSTSVALRRDFAQAFRTLMRALVIKPLQPELRNIMGEAAGMAHDFDSMKMILGKNMEILDGLAENGLAALSLASMYHKIGHCYIKAGMGADALLPIQKALWAAPTFRPALVDLVFTYYLLSDRNAAEYSLELLRLALRNSHIAWESDSDAVRLEKQVSSMSW